MKCIRENGEKFCIIKVPISSFGISSHKIGNHILLDYLLIAINHIKQFQGDIKMLKKIATGIGYTTGTVLGISDKIKPVMKITAEKTSKGIKTAVNKSAKGIKTAAKTTAKGMGYTTGTVLDISDRVKPVMKITAEKTSKGIKTAVNKSAKGIKTAAKTTAKGVKVAAPYIPPILVGSACIAYMAGTIAVAFIEGSSTSIESQKTTYVKGHWREGTWVNGHFRRY